MAEITGLIGFGLLIFWIVIACCIVSGLGRIGRAVETLQMIERARRNDELRALEAAEATAKAAALGNARP